jgi:hypothetical protein
MELVALLGEVMPMVLKVAEAAVVLAVLMA